MIYRLHIKNIEFIQWFRKYPIIILTAVIVALIQMFAFKYIYPYPNFLPDSYSYIEAAVKQQPINKWPIGYSKFLLWFSFITRNHTGLVWLQYMLLQASIFYFTYTFSTLLHSSKFVFGILLFAAVCTPLTYMASNLVSSDALFAACSLIWFSQILWISYKPNLMLLLVHALIITIAFTMRYNALYYPLISFIVIVFTKMNMQVRLIGFGVTSLLLGAFIGYTQYHYQKITGRIQFSALNGWQLANNALYAYSHVPANKRVQSVREIAALQSLANRHIDSLQQLQQRPHVQLGEYYLSNNQSPLIQHMRKVCIGGSTVSDLKCWTIMSQRYKRLGMWLIETNPKEYVQYYLWPNLINFYVPKTEFLGNYNMGNNTIEDTGKSWFLMKDNKIHFKYLTIVKHIIQYIPIALALINWMFLLAYAGFIYLKGLTHLSLRTKHLFYWLFIIWISNLSFSVLVSPIVIRYQLFPMLITQTFMLYMFGFIIKTGIGAKYNPIHNRLNKFAKT